jgi:SAM-dependent methyltransferase
MVLFVNDHFAIEKEYLGTYADLPQHEETEIIRRLSEKPWREVVGEEFFDSNPWLYRIICDPGRDQCLDVINFPTGGVYLDIGSGWGQLTIPLAKQGTAVAFDLTRNRLDILNEIAEQERVNVEKIQGNFLSFPFRQQIFDLVIFNGSLEWIGSGRSEMSSIRDIQIDALKKAGTLLKPNGKLYVGIENSIGAKYVMGTNDDHTGLSHLMYLNEVLANSKYLENKGDILPAKTWSLFEYYNMFDEAGLELDSVYACFPDYKLVRSMVRLETLNDFILDGYLQVSEHDGSNGESLQYQNELDQFYLTLAKNKVAQFFCPSYGFVLKKKG